MDENKKIFLFWGGAVLGCLLIFLLFIFLRNPAELKTRNALELGYIAFEQENYDAAIRYFMEGELSNVPEASYALGAMYFAGKGVPVNLDRALTLYHKAAIQEYTPALTTLALFYAEGKYVPKDLDKAHEYAGIAAEKGDAEAQSILATWYENGTLGEKDIDTAIALYQVAAMNGDMNAKTALFAIYKEGLHGISPNVYKAMRWQNSLEKQREFELIFLNQPIPEKRLKPKPERPYTPIK